MSEAVIRRFARDQWVRVHGTPRITVLVGGAAGPALWRTWLSVGALDGELLDAPLDAAAPDAAARAIAEPMRPIAISCTPEALASWRAGRADRLAAMIAEGIVQVPEPGAPGADPDGEPGGEPGDEIDGGPDATLDADAMRRGPAPPGQALTRDRPRGYVLDARSAAEAALFEALEATPATRGRFELNGYLAVRFGANAAEVDLLSRGDRIAIEVDGYYHFGDLDAYRRDRKKDRLLQSQGLFVIRVLAQDVMKDARPAVTAVCEALAARMRDPS